MPLVLSNELLKEYVTKCLEPDEAEYSYKLCILDSSTASKLLLGVAATFMIKTFCLVKTQNRIILIALSKLNEVNKVISYSMNEISEFSCKKGFLVNYIIKLRTKSGDKYEFKANNMGHGNLEPFINFSI